MEIADAMRALGIVDNEGAKRRGMENSVWKQRENAVEWLDRRRRMMLSWRDEVRIARKAGRELPAMPHLPQYPEALDAICAPGLRRSQPNQRLLNPVPLAQPVFKGRKMQEEEEEEEDELLDPSAMRDMFGDPDALVRGWRRCLSRWKNLTRRAVRGNHYRHAGLLPAIAEDIQEAEALEETGMPAGGCPTAERQEEVGQRLMEIEYE
jgi:hypothetical protein